MISPPPISTINDKPIITKGVFGVGAGATGTSCRGTVVDALVTSAPDTDDGAPASVSISARVAASARQSPRLMASSM